MAKKEADSPKSTGANSKSRSAGSKSQVFDVSKPGSSPASPNSRPIIVGHGSMLKKDPMVVESSDPEIAEESTAAAKVLLKPKNKIEPLKKTDEEKTSEDNASDNAEKDTSDTDSKTDEEQPVSTEGENTENNEASDAGAIDALASEADNQKQDKESAKKQTEEAERLQKIADSKEYFLPITEGGRKRNAERIATWLLLILLLSSAGVYYAIDAGYLDIGINLPFDLIKNK